MTSGIEKIVSIIFVVLKTIFDVIVELTFLSKLRNQTWEFRGRLKQYGKSKIHQLYPITLTSVQKF